MNEEIEIEKIKEKGGLCWVDSLDPAHFSTPSPQVTHSNYAAQFPHPLRFTDTSGRLDSAPSRVGHVYHETLTGAPKPSSGLLGSGQTPPPPPPLWVWNLLAGAQNPSPAAPLSISQVGTSSPQAERACRVKQWEGKEREVDKS
jgi:hypothetical protein